MIIERHLTEADLGRTLRSEVADGLRSRPKVLSPKWFYDARGSALFEEITRLDEYYLTRAERAVLRARADDIAYASGADTLLELGAGSAEKTHLLLGALAAAGTLKRYVPVDVSDEALVDAAHRVAAAYPGIDVHGVVGDLDRHLDLLPSHGRRLIAFLGSTIGNMSPLDRAAFLRAVRTGMVDGDALLLGTDLVKERDRLLAAYDDADGVTARFNRNVLHVLNRRVGADFAPESFEHVAVWEEAHAWIEMRLRSSRPQRVRVADLDMAVEFAEGEDMRTEVSAKFRREGVTAELRAAGLSVQDWWTDPAGDFAVSLSVPD